MRAAVEKAAERGCNRWDWTEAAPDAILRMEVDVVLAADVVYTGSSMAALAEALSDLLVRKRCPAFLMQQVRGRTLEESALGGFLCMCEHHGLTAERMQLQSAVFEQMPEISAGVRIELYKIEAGLAVGGAAGCSR
jgi:hypothetical protein